MCGMCSSWNGHKDCNLSHWLLSCSNLGGLRNLTLLPLQPWIMLDLDVCDTCEPVDLWTYGPRRKDPVLSKGPFVPYHHKRTDFCTGDLLASTNLVDVSCIGCPFQQKDCTGDNRAVLGWWDMISLLGWRSKIGCWLPDLSSSNGTGDVLDRNI